MKTLQEILMEEAKARAAVEQGTDQLSEIDNADFAKYALPGMPKIENPSSIPLQAGTSHAELLKQQAIPADYMQNATAEAEEQDLASRAPAGIPSPKVPTLDGSQEHQGEQPLGIGERLENLMKERNAAYAQAEKNQRRQELIGSLAGNLGNIIGGAQAMNTGASVTPAKTGFTGQDLTTGVDKQYKPELDSMLAQYKALQAAKAKQGTSDHQDRMYNLELAQMAQRDRMFDRSQDGRETMQQLTAAKAGSLSDAQAKGLTALVDARTEVENLIPLAKKVNLGPIDTPFNKLKNKVGLAPEFGELERNYAGVRNTIRNALFGSALTKTEKDEFDKELNEISISDDAFDQNLSSYMNKLERKIAATAETVSKTQPLKAANVQKILGKSSSTSTSYPKQVRNSKGEVATVSNAEEEKEAKAEGFN